MRRYYFDMADGWLSTDTEGTRFPDLKAARAHAIKLSAEVLRARSDDFVDEDGWTFLVRDDRGEPVFRLSVNGATLVQEAEG